jgi:coenzyme Q-binding protein COQ10
VFREERRVRHNAVQMFDLVADVERYPEFVPLCKALRVRSRRPRWTVARRSSPT